MLIKDLCGKIAMFSSLLSVNSRSVQSIIDMIIPELAWTSISRVLLDNNSSRAVCNFSCFVNVTYLVLHLEAYTWESTPSVLLLLISQLLLLFNFFFCFIMHCMQILSNQHFLLFWNWSHTLLTFFRKFQVY